MTDLYLNGEPMIWMTVTEDEFGDLRFVASSECKDYLTTVSIAHQHMTDRTIPSDYWGKR